MERFEITPAGRAALENAEPSREEIRGARRAYRLNRDPHPWRALCARYPVWHESGGSADAWADDSREYA